MTHIGKFGQPDLFYLMTISIVDDGNGDQAGNDYKWPPSQRWDNDNKDLNIYYNDNAERVCVSVCCLFLPFTPVGHKNLHFRLFVGLSQ